MEVLSLQEQSAAYAIMIARKMLKEAPATEMKSEWSVGEIEVHLVEDVGAVVVECFVELVGYPFFRALVDLLIYLCYIKHSKQLLQ